MNVTGDEGGGLPSPKPSSKNTDCAEPATLGVPLVILRLSAWKRKSWVVAEVAPPTIDQTGAPPSGSLAVRFPEACSAEAASSWTEPVASPVTAGTSLTPS